MLQSVTWASDLDPANGWSQVSGDPRDTSQPVFTNLAAGRLVLFPPQCGAQPPERPDSRHGSLMCYVHCQGNRAQYSNVSTPDVLMLTMQDLLPFTLQATRLRFRRTNEARLPRESRNKPRPFKLHSHLKPFLSGREATFRPAAHLHRGYADLGQT